DHGRWDHDLVKGLEIHEHEVIAVTVEVLVFRTIHGCKFQLGAGVPGLVHDLVGGQVFDFGAHKRATFTWLDVLEFLNLPKLAVDDDNRTVSNIVTGEHDHGGEFSV